MVSTDPIADMLSRIRNAISVNKIEISLPHSKVKQQVAEILVASGFLKQVDSVKDDHRAFLHITVNEANRPAVITDIERISRPGRRVYASSKNIPIIKRGRGIVIVSTNQGLMTGDQARSKQLGGELICKVY
ncbi:30S ribosomal protein S8 [Candidatus Saccharibacteria bacterium RIFCSPHIGHO2_12_FULL_49_19]|nr:MAG: 30S ribosomal protein S8 [Candidatus Saccharibacteria bacterium RIFCSPHIGHO2_01_FULL_49_21]OGL37786.1 MAG: 30S ribosomal protein S8 [Candidatus Saccharibacteria bacterium RIFCSPHIGHO2_12_FULL_49_19]OGL38577.1 MAG: 30S ribosomal protein S8 [Candidatus Saccharibacteria bacterium RIFCSPLOWO2_01_FULL_49_22]